MVLKYKEFLEVEEVVLEDWRLWSLGISPGEIQKNIREWYDEYLKFKLGNLSKYFEIEIFPEHAVRLLPHMIECPLKEILVSLKEGYLVLRKDF